MNTKKTPDHPISTDSGTGTEEAHLVDEVLQQHSDVHTLGPEDVEISEQLKAMRVEVDRISESVGLLAEGVKTVVQQMPTMLEEEFGRYAYSPDPSIAEQFTILAA